MVRKRVFCPKCHRLVAEEVELEDGSRRVIVNGKNLITLGGNVVIDRGGKQMKGISTTCPMGHRVVVGG